MNVKRVMIFFTLFSIFKHNFKRPRSYVYFYELIDNTITSKQSTCNMKIFLYGRYIEGKQLSIRAGTTNNVKNLSSRDTAGFNLCRRQRNGKIKRSALEMLSRLVQSRLIFLGVA